MAATYFVEISKWVSEWERVTMSNDRIPIFNQFPALITVCSGVLQKTITSQNHFRMAREKTKLFFTEMSLKVWSAYMKTYRKFFFFKERTCNLFCVMIDQWNGRMAEWQNISITRNASLHETKVSQKWNCNIYWVSNCHHMFLNQQGAHKCVGCGRFSVLHVTQIICNTSIME